MPEFEKRENLIEILDATSEDVPGIIAVQKETWLATYPNEEYGITVEDIQSRDWDSPSRAERWQKSIVENGGANRVWVAKEGERVIAFSSAIHQADKNRLGALYVLPEYQGRGIGQKLIRKVFDWFGDRKDITVEVAKYNTGAINFYKKSGFQGERDLPPSSAGRLPSGKLIPEIEMVKPHQNS